MAERHVEEDPTLELVVTMVLVTVFAVKATVDVVVLAPMMAFPARAPLAGTDV